MPDRTVAVIQSGFEDATGLDTGVSHALLERVSAGELPESFRIYQPTRVVAFGKQDRLATGFDRAVQITRDHGFDPIIRMPGGRAAVFTKRRLHSRGRSRVPIRYAAYASGSRRRPP